MGFYSNSVEGKLYWYGNDFNDAHRPKRLIFYWFVTIWFKISPSCKLENRKLMTEITFLYCYPKLENISSTKATGFYVK